MNTREFKNLIYAEIAVMGKAVADPRRLEILDLLSQAEKNVDLLSRETGMSMATTSHHLQILKEAKMVADRKEGKFVFYRISNAGKSAWRMISTLAEENIAEIRKLMQEFFNGEEEASGLDYQNFIKQVNNQEIILLDVRPAYEYESDHIPGSVSMPLKELEEKIKSLPKKKEIVAYCRGRYCVLSHEAVGMLRKKGFKAYRLPDGVEEFREKAG